MRISDRTGEAGWQLSPAARRRVMRAAFLRPWGLVVPLTLATYAALVLLAARDPLLKSRTLERWESQSRTQLGSSTDRDISPERRARWLPRGETRRKVEATLEIYQRTMVAIEESGDVARTVLDDTVPKLRRIAERLVDIAEKREKAADAIRELDSVYTSPRQREGRDVDLGELKEEIRAADAEISHILKQLTILQIRLVRLSLESSRGKVRDAAADVSTDLDEINLRLDALHTTVSPPRAPDR